MSGRRLFRREGFALVTALASVLVVGAALTGGFYAVCRSSMERRAAESANVLAQEALRAFALQANAAELSRIEVGGDSLVTRVRILSGTSLTGAFTVQVAHVAPSTFSIRSTGRLETPSGPVICSVALHWRPAAEDARLDPGRAPEPVCNGGRTREQLVVRAHES